MFTLAKHGQSICGVATPRRWQHLATSMGVAAVALIASAQAQDTSHPHGHRHGPPTVPQAPPFAVPEDGYAVEGRPGNPGSGYVHHYDTRKVAWQPFTAPGYGDGLYRRLLSRSDTMEAISQITYVPAGWVQPAGYDAVDVETIVLDGDLTIGTGANAEHLGKYGYSFIPAGMWRAGAASRQGAVLLQWFKGAPTYTASASGKADARVNARVRHQDHFKATWYIDKPFPDYRTGGNFPGALHKMLRTDPDTGEMTWMTFASSIPAPVKGPGNFGGGYEVHPSFEEYYFLEKTDDTVIGECLEQGETDITYGNGTYWWRPGGVGHGGHVGKASEDPAYTISIVRTGTPLWATYVTNCTYETGIEFTGKGWRNYDYDVPRYRVKK